MGCFTSTSKEDEQAFEGAVGGAKQPGSLLPPAFC